LVGRGVLIDYKAWADRQGIKFNPFDAHRITIKDIEAVAKEEGVEFKQGDIIIVRSGFTEALGTMNAEQQTEAMGSHRTCGVEGTEESAKWFWNKHFSAVAGDAIAFEAIPPIVNGKESTVADLGTFAASSLPTRY
jgi:kynurenine formamidase